MTDANVIDTPEQRMQAGQAAGWRQMLDSLDPAACAAYRPVPQVVAGYPQYAGQGQILANGQIVGWLKEDFQEFRTAGINVARIANLSPAWHECSIADVEAGALTFADARKFVMGREGFRRGTSTIYASLDNWPAVGRACKGAEPSWAWVAFWPAYPSLAEVAQIRQEVAAACPGTRLAGIQYRNLPAANVDLSVLIAPTWHAHPA